MLRVMTMYSNLHLAHGYGSAGMQEPGDIMTSGKFEFTLVTGAEETPETHREQVKCGTDTLHKRLKECAYSEDWMRFLVCSVCPTTRHKTYTAKIHVAYGRGSNTMEEPGDILISEDFEFRLVTSAEENLETHRELVTRVIDELHKTMEDCTCGQEFWKPSISDS
jgi:hypothetical protein